MKKRFNLSIYTILKYIGLISFILGLFIFYQVNRWLGKFNTQSQNIERVEFSNWHENTYSSVDQDNVKLNGFQKRKAGNEGRAQLLTKELLELKNSFLSMQNSNGMKKALLSKLIEKAKERRRYLLNLMDINPVEVIEVSLSTMELKSFPIALIPFLEQKISVTGFLQEDDTSTSNASKQFFKTKSDELIEVKLVDKKFAGNEKKEIKVTGIYLNEMDNEISSSKGKMVVTSSQKTSSN